MKKESPPVNNFKSRYGEYEILIKLIKEENDRFLNEFYSKRPPKPIQELIDQLQLDHIPINGKYRPASGNYKKFVYWIVDNKYDEILTQDNFFTFIHCTVKEENIKRYFREAQDSQK